MKSTKINAGNFDYTLVGTEDHADSKDGLNTYYLDHFTRDGKDYYAVSQDERIVGCWDTYEEAEKKFNQIVKLAI